MNNKEDRHKTVNIPNMTLFFSIIVSTPIRNDLHVPRINSFDIYFHSSSIAVLKKTIFGWGVVFVLFSKTPISRGFRSGLDESHKETPIILEFF